MAVLPKNVELAFEFYWAAFDAWTDFTAFVTSNFEAEMGMIDDDYDTRLADPATVTFSVNNLSEDFPTPTFDKGTLIRVLMTYDGRTKTKFYGFVEDYEPDPGTTGEGKLHITCTDWLAHAINQPVRERAVETSRRYDYGITKLLEGMPIQPLDTSIEQGIDILNTIFDQIDRNTSLYQEVYRMILSEYGYGYMDRGGERFKTENRNARGFLKGIKQLPKANDGSFLKKVDGSYLLKVDGGKILLNQTQDADFDNTIDTIRISDLRIVRGKHVLNEVEFTAFPKSFDTSVQVVYSMPHDTPLFIPALSTVEFEGYFSNPHAEGSGERIGATSFVTPVASTDYFFYENSDETGSNYTANLVITPTYYADRVKWSIQNTSYAGYLTHLNLRGYGIYPSNPISVVKSDQNSKDTYGVRSLSIKQPYQQYLSQGTNEAERILDQERESRSVCTLLTYVANASDFNMQAFLHCDIGDLIHVKCTKPVVDSNFFINGMRWKIDWETGYIYCTYILKEMPTFSQLALEFSTGGSNQAIDYGNPPILNNVVKTTFFMRIYQKNASAGYCPLMGKYSGAAEKVITLDPDGKLIWTQGFTGSVPQWRTNTGAMDSYIDEWTTIAVTYDGSSIANDPIFYVNGASVANTEETAPVGTMLDDSPTKFLVVNGSYPGADYPYDLDGVIKDVRVYNRILSATEIANLDTNDDPDYGVDTSLIFQAPFVRNFRLTDYIDNVISTTDKIFDRVNLRAGTPHYDPAIPIIGRDPNDTGF